MRPIDPETVCRLDYAGPRFAEYQARRDQADHLAQSGDLEGSLRSAAEAASQAYTYLGGFFADAGLDELVIQVVEKILEASNPAPRPASPALSPSKAACDVLHLVSYTGFVGGHSELLRLWLKGVQDEGIRQALFSTEILASVELERWSEFFERADSVYFSNSALSFSQRAIQLAQYLRLVKPKLVTSFLHPHDVIAVGVLGALRRRAPGSFQTLFVNHADHAFWLGASVADRVVEFRSLGETYSRRYRGISSTTVIPLASNVSIKGHHRAQARETIRREFHLPSQTTLSLSVASLYKILGSRWDFIDAIIDMLRAQPEHHHLLILGHGEELIRKRVRDAGLQDRFHVEGKRVDLVPYYLGSDFLIETFPLMGGNVRQEAMTFGLPIVVPRPAGFEQNTLFLGLPDGYPVVSHQVELLALVSAFLHQPEERTKLGQALAEFARRHFSREKVLGEVSSLVRQILGNKKIPTSSPNDDGRPFPFDRMHEQYALSRAEQEFLAGNTDRGLQQIAYAARSNGSTPALHAVLRRNVEGLRLPTYGDEDHSLLTSGLQAWSEGNLAGAIDEFKSALAERSGLSAGWKLLADTWIEVGQRELATTALQRAVAIDPTDASSRLLLAEIYLGANMPAEAHQLAQQIVAHNEFDVDGLLLLAHLCRLAQKEETAITVQEFAAQIEPRHPRIAGPSPWFTGGEPPRVSVVVTAFNNLLLTHRCLESIRVLADPRIEEVIVCDNGSTDGTLAYLEALARRWHLLRVVRSEANEGFARGANQAARAATRPFLLFVDNDARLRPGSLSPLVEDLLADPTVGMVGGKLVWPHGPVDHAGYALVRNTRPGSALEIVPFSRGLAPNDAAVTQRLIVRGVASSFFLTRRETFFDVDGFHEGFINGLEDIDLSLRIGLTGKKVLFEPAAVAIHDSGASGWARYQHRPENHRQFWNRWQSQLEPDFVREADGLLRRADHSIIDAYQPPGFVAAAT